MKRLVFFSMWLVSSALSARADVLFESGTLGATGVSYGDLGGAVPGTNVNTSVFVGVRFQLDERAVTSEIGGHFVASSGGTFFGAIVELDDGNDFPDSEDLLTLDVLGHSLLTFPNPSAEVFADLSLELDPGWYALVFGSGLFAATGSGGAVRNGTDIGNPSYIALQPLSAFGWVNITTNPNFRLVILNDVVPEPSTCALILLASPSFLLTKRA